MKLARIFLVTLLAAMVSSCSSIMSGRSQNITIQSNPSGATVKMNGNVLGVTPLTVAMERKGSRALAVEKEGFKPMPLNLESRINGWFWGNIVFGGFFGSSTDAGTGSLHEYTQSQYMVSLEALGAGSMETHANLNESQKLKDFIVVGYAGIISDIRKGDGDYLKSLHALLKIPSDKAAEATKRIKALSEAYPSIPEFADHVAEAFAEKKPSK